MAFRLKSYTKYPPDGFYYGHMRAEGGIRQLATRLSDYRTANNYPRSSWEESFADIEQFTVERLGHDPKWVEDTEAVPYSPPSRQRAGGGCCGAKIQ